MGGFFAKQCVDATGIQAVKLEKSILLVLYIGVLAIELVLGVIGTALWVVQGVVISSTKLQVIGGPDQRSQTAVSVSATLAATIPIVILINAARLKIALKEEKKQHRASAVEERVLLLVEEIVTQQLYLPAAPVSTPPKPLQSKPNSNSNSNANLPHHPHRSHHQKHKLKQTQAQAQSRSQSQLEDPTQPWSQPQLLQSLHVQVQPQPQQQPQPRSRKTQVVPEGGSPM